MYTFIPSPLDSADPDAIPPGSDDPVLMQSHDLRALGLESASDRLRMRVADMDVVHVARAKVDIRLCPACPLPHGG
jgi:hypothetical protein